MSKVLFLVMVLNKCTPMIKWGYPQWWQSKSSYAYLYTGERYKKVSYQNGQPTHTTYYLYDNGILLAEIYQDNRHKWHYDEYLHLGVRPVIKFGNKTPILPNYRPSWSGNGSN